VMMNSIKILVGAAIAVSLTGCAQLQEYARQQQENQRINTCNFNSAYSQGVNDAQANQPMNANYADICLDNQMKVQSSYRRGYLTGLRHRPREIININVPRHSQDINAGPIWNNDDANGKCPNVCSSHQGHWNGQWVTTQIAQQSVCRCEF